MDEGPREGLRTVLMTDIVGSTMRQAELGDEAWRDLLLAHRREVRSSLDRWHGFENDTAGDGFYATFVDSADAVRCALEIVRQAGPLELEVRAGVHRGTCELAEDRCSGLAVSIGARVAALANGSEVLVTDAVRTSVPDGTADFADRGLHTLRGVPGQWRLHLVSDQGGP